MAGADIQFLAAHVMWLPNSLPGLVLDRVALRRHVTYIPPNPRAGFPDLSHVSSPAELTRRSVLAAQPRGRPCDFVKHPFRGQPCLLPLWRPEAPIGVRPRHNAGLDAIVHRLAYRHRVGGQCACFACSHYALGFAGGQRLIAEQQSPRIQRAAVAGPTSPNPCRRQQARCRSQLSLGIENYPISGMDRWSMTRESMTMQRLVLMQEVPNRAKRDAQVASAQACGSSERR